MRHIHYLFSLAAGIAFATLPAHARVVMPAQLGDHAVLQQQTDVNLWGLAKPGSTVTATPSWTDKASTAKADKAGRWKLTVATPAASYTPVSINVSDGDGPAAEMKDVLIGEVWFCSGQSNMEMPLRGFWTQPVEGAADEIAHAHLYKSIRVVTIPKRKAYEKTDTVSGSWKVANSVNAPEFTALGWFFAKELNALLDVPVGLVSCAYGGSKAEGWLPEEILAGYTDFDYNREKADTAMNDWERIGVMYNAMMYPVRNYTVRGMIWNQGESNVGRHATYPLHLADMVENWRRDHGDTQARLPFYQVEIPGWDYSNPDATDAAFLRESQHKAAEIIPNSGIVCAADLVYDWEVKDIHARQKRPIGERMARQVAETTYGLEGMPWRGPVFNRIETEGNKAILHFDNAWEGLSPNNTPLPGFEVAGADGVYHPATAIAPINTRVIEVSSPEVSEVKNVRFGFKNFSPSRVFNLYGLPLVPFRTDNFDR